MSHVPRGRCFAQRISTLLAAQLLLAGCLPASRLGVENPTPASTSKERPTTRPAWLADANVLSSSGEPVQVVHVVFDVLRMDLPLRDRRQSTKIWNHVDELRVDGELAARLARNGVRLGVASDDSWPAISTILRASEARTREEQLFAQPGLPVTIIVGLIQEPESIFSYTRTNQLVGKTFSAGEKLITLDYAFRPELGGLTDVQVLLEIRNDPGTMTWERHEGVILQVPQMERDVFADLAVSLTLRSGEFLMMGPGEKADQSYLVGGRLFTRRESNAERYETLFRVTPKPYQRQELRRAS